MKLKFKLMAAAVALAASVGAHAAIANGDTGNGGLIFTVWDAGLTDATTDDRAYLRDLSFGSSLLQNGVDGGNLDNWASATTNVAPGPALVADKQTFPNTIFNVAADANLQSFLAATNDLSRLQWNIVAADGNGTDRHLTTSTSIAPMTYTQFRTLTGGVNTYLSNVNPQLGANESINLFGGDAWLGLWGDNVAKKLVGSTNAAGINNPLNFFVMSERAASGSTTTLTDVQQFKTAKGDSMQWTLAADGGLTYVAAVPEPSEYALMLAGLGMLGFIARRRLNNRA